jgi:hypothetical protein
MKIVGISAYYHDSAAFFALLCVYMHLEFVVIDSDEKMFKHVISQ